MATRVYQFYTTSSQANACSLQFVAKGRITGVTWCCHLDGTADNNAFTAECSFNMGSQLATHNAQGIVSAIDGCYQNFTTSGAINGSWSYYDGGLNIGVNTGDVVYINTSISGAAVIKGLVHVEE